MYASPTYLMNFFVDLVLLEIPLTFSTFKKIFLKKCLIFYDIELFQFIFYLFD